jgi:hypothetical protein
VRAAFDPFADASPTDATNIISISTLPTEDANGRLENASVEDGSRPSNSSTAIIAVSLLAGIVLLILAGVALYKYRKPKSRRFISAKPPAPKPKKHHHNNVQRSTQPVEYHYTESHFSHQPSPTVLDSNFVVYSFASPKMPSISAQTELSSEASANSSRGFSEMTVLDPRKSNFAQAPPTPAFSRMTIDPETRVNQIYDEQPQRDTELEDSHMSQALPVVSGETGPSFLQQDPKTNSRNSQRTTHRGSTWSRWSKIV